MCEWICLTVLQMNNVLTMSPFVLLMCVLRYMTMDDMPTQYNDSFVLECVVTWRFGGLSTDAFT